MSAPADLTLSAALADFTHDLQLDKSPKTIDTYTESVRSYIAWAEANGITTISAITPRSIRDWLLSLQQAGRRQATVFNRHAGVRAWVRWMMAEELLTENPMATIKPPPLAEIPVPMLSHTQTAALLRACEGRDFDAIRDAALLRLMVDTGVRRAECAHLRVADVDREHSQVTVRGKGNRVRTLPFGLKTGRALRRYLRVRDQHSAAARPELWLGRRGPLGLEGPIHVIRRRARMAGITQRVHPHMLRHGWAATMMSRLNEGDVQRLGGWKNRDMLSRYGAANAAERAIAAYQGNAPGDDY